MFKRTLLITIIAIVTIVGISNIIFTSNVLVNDFMTKAYQLSKQYADSLELKLNNIVETITIFEDKKNLSSLIIDERNSYEVINVLSEIKETNLNIMGATIVNMKGDIFFSSSEFGEVFLNSAISNDYLIYLKEKIIKPTYILKDDFNKNNEYAYTAQELLLYVKPLSDSGYVTGYMVVISSIDNLIKSLNLDDTLFMEKANLYLYNNNETLLASTLENEKINNKITIDSDMSKGSYRTIDFKHFTTYNIIIDNMLGLAIDIPIINIINHNVKFVVLILIVICIILILFIILFRYFIKGIISPLNKLYDDMNGYIEKKTKMGDS